jgi:hypothetical protein
MLKNIFPPYAATWRRNWQLICPNCEEREREEREREQRKTKFATIYKDTYNIKM